MGVSGKYSYDAAPSYFGGGSQENTRMMAHHHISGLQAITKLSFDHVCGARV